MSAAAAADAVAAWHPGTKIWRDIQGHDCVILGTLLWSRCGVCNFVISSRILQISLGLLRFP